MAVGCRLVKVVGITDNSFIISDGTKKKVISRSKLEEFISAGKIKVTATKVKSIYKERDKNGVIIEYTLIDKNGTKRKYKPVELKEAIRNYQLEVTNLTLTKDNRLVDSKNAEPEQEAKKKSAVSQSNHNQQPIKKTQDNKAEQQKPQQAKPKRDVVLTKETNELIKNKIISKMEEKKYYGDVSIIYIGSNSKKYTKIPLGTIQKVEGTPFSLIVYFSANKCFAVVMPTNAEKESLKLPSNSASLFEGFHMEICELLDNSLGTETWGRVEESMASIILDGLDWSAVESTEKMFKDAFISRVTILNSVAPKLKNAYGMFMGSTVESVNMSGLRASAIERTTAMFMNCDSLNQDKTNLSGLNFKTVKFIGKMFYIPSKNTSKNRKQNVDKLIEQCKKLGWNGYSDGRPDDFTTILSSKQETKQKSKAVKRGKHTPRTIDIYQQQAINDRKSFLSHCYADGQMLGKLKEAYASQ